MLHRSQSLLPDIESPAGRPRGRRPRLSVGGSAQPEALIGPGQYYYPQ